MTNLKFINIIKNYTLIDKRIELYFFEKKFNFKNINKIFNKINGRYTMLINEYILFDKEDLKNFYNVTNGKISYIFHFTIKKKHKIHLIKIKVLCDIYDNNNFSFNNINELISYINLMPNPIVNYISVAYCPNIRYVPLVYVSMNSILISKVEYSFISFYLIIPSTFNKKSFQLLLSLYEQYDFFNITFIKMDEKYNKAFTSRYITIQAYYRFSLGELIPYLNKIIYLDTDVICYKDLSSFYNLNFKGKMILGQIIPPNNVKKTGYYTINSGILLLNLKEMRKLKIEKKVINLISKGYKNQFHDQSIINNFFYKNIGVFPPQYHTKLFVNYDDIRKFNEKTGNIYDTDYLYFSWKYPVIRHYVGFYKPNYNNKYNKEDWWYFARISKYYKRKTFNLMKIFEFD